VKTLYEAMLDPELFGSTFGGPTFAAWRAVAKFLDGLPLEPSELDLWTKITGREAPPTASFSEAYLVKPRRAGGTLFAAAVALHAALQDYLERLGPGEIATVALIASDRRQARQALNYVKGLIANSSLISAEHPSETAETVTFAHGTALEVHTTSFRSTRGYSYAAVILDELAFFRDDLSANPDVELVRAVRPGLANLRGRLLGLSSPHSRRGHLFEMFRQHFAKPSRVLVIKAGGPTLNPTIDQDVIAQARIDDPIAARSEWDADFREDISQYLEDALIDQALSPGTKSRPRQEGCVYAAFCDPSGGRHDSMTLGIAHQEVGGKVVLDKLIKTTPPFEPDTVVALYAQTLGAYGLSRVVGDRYAGEWVSAAFRRHSIQYVPSPQDKSAIYVDCLPLFTQGMVTLVDSPALETELRLLERRPRPNGKGDLVDHPPRACDDAANSALAALLLASRHPTVGVEARATVARTLSDYDPMTLDEDRARRRQPEDRRPAWMRPTIYFDD
jgi:hypothetical protein